MYFAVIDKERRSKLGETQKLHKHRSLLNLLTPNVNYSGRTAPLTSKVAFYILIQ